VTLVWSFAIPVYVQAAAALGAGNGRIILRHILTQPGLGDPGADHPGTPYCHFGGILTRFSWAGNPTTQPLSVQMVSEVRAYLTLTPGHWCSLA